jgi:phosphoribosylformylglycinamidine synthase
VQVPDPFLKNVIMRASYAVFAELRANGITAGFKDLGAGGLAGCSAELCAAGGMGAEVELERVSTAQRDLPPEVIAIGETQERLCWIVPPAFTPTLLSIYNDIYSLPRIARGACAAVIGKVTDTGRYVARHHGETVMDVDLQFLTGGVRYQRPYLLPQPVREPVSLRYAEVDRRTAERPVQTLSLLRSVLGHRDVCSRATIYRRYDGVVRGCTALPPGYADSGVLVPIPGAPLAVATGMGGNPRYGKLDPRRAAELAVLEAVANVTAVGATPVGLTDCLNFGDPTVPEQMGAFVAAVDGLAEAARALEVPFVSGNVSLYNRSSSGNHVAPSPIVGCIGTLDDVSRMITPGFKETGSVLVVLAPPWQSREVQTVVGSTPDSNPNTAFANRQPERLRPVARGLGGSVVAELLGLETAVLSDVDYEWFGRACRFVRDANKAGMLLSAHDSSDGGMLVAITEMAFAAGDRGRSLGCFVFDWRETGWNPVWAFNESPGFVLEVKAAAYDEFRLLANRAWIVGIAPFGSTVDEPVLQVRSAERGIVVESVSIAELRKAWEAPLRDFYGLSQDSGPSTSSGPST